jgi:predicted  nucleic acid-binding Zn-ribbon protein
MEHLCVGCGHIELNNVARMTAPCPKCGAVRWASISDEAPETEKEENEEEE